MIQQTMAQSLIQSSAKSFGQSLARRMLQWASPNSITAPLLPSASLLPLQSAPLPTVATAMPKLEMIEPQQPKLCIRRHPSDLRRTVISGRFADVCAALEGLAAAEPEPEAA